MIPMPSESTGKAHGLKTTGSFGCNGTGQECEAKRRESGLFSKGRRFLRPRRLFLEAVVPEKHGRSGKERRNNMDRIVILKGPSVDFQGEYVLTECLKTMFPDCEVEIRSTLPENSPDLKD
jgi:hypothetical protein